MLFLTTISNLQKAFFKSQQKHPIVCHILHQNDKFLFRIHTYVHYISTLKIRTVHLRQNYENGSFTPYTHTQSAEPKRAENDQIVEGGTKQQVGVCYSLLFTFSVVCMSRAVCTCAIHMRTSV